MTIVYAPGCWDLLHVGHVRFLERAKRLGDKLVVGVASDAVVLQDKGQPPLVPQEQRREMLEALLCVDAAVVYNEFAFVKELAMLSADVLAVGEQWGSAPRHWDAEQWIKEHNGKVVRLPRTGGVSTTQIKERMKR